jgi:CHAD domain-containing protein
MIAAMAKRASKRSKQPKHTGYPLQLHVDELLDDLRKLIGPASKGADEDSVHDARVATRRLKAAMDLLEPVLSDKHRKPFTKTLRGLRRSLGDLRDTDVMRGHLAEIGKSSQKHDAAVQWLQDQLRKQRDSAQEKAREKIPPARVLAKLGTWWGLRSEIDEAEEAVDSLLAQSLHAQFDDFAKNADALAADPRHTDPHALRIAGKSLRYTLEMAAAEGHEVPPAVMKTFKRIQDALGLWHDYVVLTEQALSLATKQQLAHHDAEMQRHVLQFARATLAKSQTQLRKVIGLWRDHADELRTAITALFPLSQEPQSSTDVQHPAAESTPPETDRGPSGSEEPAGPGAVTPDAA